MSLSITFFFLVLFLRRSLATTRCGGDFATLPTTLVMFVLPSASARCQTGSDRAC